VTLSIVATPVVGSPPSVLLSVTGTVSSPAVDLNGAVALVRIHADGSRHAVITEYDPHLLSGLWAVTDSHPPYNQAVTYEVTVGSVTASVAAVVMSSVTWLVPAGEVEMAAACRVVTEISEVSYPEVGGVFPILNGKTISVTGSDPVGGASGSMTVYAESASDRDALVSLLRRGGPILIDAPGDPGWDVRWMWVTTSGLKTSTPERWNRGKQPERYISFSFTEIEDPDVDLIPIWTDADMEAAFASDAAGEAAFADAFHAELNRRL